MLLSVLERLLLLQVLPGDGDFTTLRVVRDLQHGLSFSEEELGKLNFRKGTNDKGEPITEWDQSVESREVDVGPAARTVLLAGLDITAAQKKARMTHLELRERLEQEVPAEQTDAPKE